MKGHLTVEASYIFPFSFLVIGIVCLLGVFCFNQAVLQMTGYECILKTMDDSELKEDDFREILIQRAETAAKERVIGISELKATTKVTASKISLTYEGIMSALNIKVKTNVIYEKVYPELSLRLMRGFTGE